MSNSAFTPRPTRMRFMAGRVYRIAKRISRTARTLRGLQYAGDILDGETYRSGITETRNKLIRAREWLDWAIAHIDWLQDGAWRDEEPPKEPTHWL